MQVDPPRYYIRNCIHYLGTQKRNPKVMTSSVHYCNAFSVEDGGIPNAIAYGNNLHLKPYRKQRNDIVFQEEMEV